MKYNNQIIKKKVFETLRIAFHHLEKPSKNEIQQPIITKKDKV